MYVVVFFFFLSWRETGQTKKRQPKAKKKKKGGRHSAENSKRWKKKKKKGAWATWASRRSRHALPIPTTKKNNNKDPHCCFSLPTYDSFASQQPLFFFFNILFLNPLCSSGDSWNLHFPELYRPHPPLRGMWTREREDARVEKRESGTMSSTSHRVNKKKKTENG